MRLHHHLVRHSSGVFHFRLIVPIDLRARVKLRVIKRSLRTSEPRAAMFAALTLAAGYAQAFARLRGGGMADFDVDALIRQMKSGGAEPKKFEIGSRQGEPFFQSDPADSLEQTQAGLALFSELMARRQDQAAAAGEPVPVQASPTTKTPVAAKSVRAAITHWQTVEMPVVRKRNARTAETRLSTMNDFATYVGEERTISELHTADVAAWVLYRISSKKNQHSTVKNRAVHIKALFASAKRAGFYPREWENPALDPVKFTKSDQEERAKTHGWQAFTEAQLKILFDPRVIPPFLAIAKSGAKRRVPVSALG